MDELTEGPKYTKYHPKWYRTRMPIFWWVHNLIHVRFITRELTSVFVAAYAVFLLFQIRALTQGPEAYEKFLAWLRTPVSIVFHGVALLFVLFHSITWFNLAPRALVLRIGKVRVPDMVIATSNYIAWAVCSIVVAWILLRG